MPSPESRVLVAVSGGADSVALLRILVELGYSVEIAHCNFGMRDAASDGDEVFVKELAADLGLECFVRRFSGADFESGRGEGVQQVARRLRYAFFEELMQEHAIPYCAIAHHADDQTETLIQSFFRGNGPVILRGMPSQRGPYFRPLLCLQKSEIIAWLTQKAQPWRHDRSNDKDDYERNLVRNQLIPVLTQLNPSFRARFQLQAERYSAQWHLLHDVFSSLSDKVVIEEADVQIVSKEAFARQLELRHFPVFLDWWLLQQGCSGTEISEIHRLSQGEIGSTYIGVAFEVLNDRDRLCFRKALTSKVRTEIQISRTDCEGSLLKIGPATLILSIEPFPVERSNNSETHWLALENLVFPLTLRLWREGDRMQPLGMPGSKRISDILIDQKRSRFEKEDAWVLEDGNGIVLLGGYRIAQRAAATPNAPCLRVHVQQSM